MSGLLRNLTHRMVARDEPVIHARSRLPYLPSPSLPVEESIERAPSEPARRREDPPSGSPVPGTARAAAVPEAPTASAPRPVVEAATPDPPRFMPPAPPAQAAPRSGPHLSDAVAGATDDPAAHDVETIPHDPREAAPPEPVVAGRREDPLGDDAPPPVSAEVPEAPRTALPEPLLARQAAPSAATAPRAASEADRQAGSARTDRDEPPAVHIHIGRIEIAAAAEAPTRRERRRPDRKPMSLEDYLARREGRTG